MYFNLMVRLSSLNGKLEEMYVELTKGYIVKGKKGKFNNLNKTKEALPLGQKL